jgi:flagellar motor protein MotB
MIPGVQGEDYQIIKVQEHTDDRPLQSTSRYSSKWVLSGARAAAAAQFLHETVGIDPKKN